jgi:hypothetical protein
MSSHSRLSSALSAYMQRLRSTPGEIASAEFFEQVNFSSDHNTSSIERTTIIELVLRENLHQRLIEDVRI